MGKHRLTCQLSLLLLLAIATRTPTRAADWTLSLRGGLAASTGSEVVDDADGRREGDGGSGGLLALAFERRLKHRIGIELGLMAAEPELAATLFDAGVVEPLVSADSVGFVAATVALPIHFGPEKIGLVVGPRLVWARMEDWTFRADGLAATFDLDDRLGLGAFLGADALLGDGPWSFSTRLDYLDLAARGRVREESGGEGQLGFDLDLVMVSVGFGYRF